MKILMLTTSFPLSEDSTSGVFVLRLIEHLPESVRVTVLTPCHKSRLNPRAKGRCRLRCFRYAPESWQTLAHEPGGIPVALKKNRKRFFVLPFFLASMGLSCVRLARNADVIHANWSVNGAIAGLAALLTRTPAITTLRGSDVRRSLGSGIEKTLLRLCLKTNDRVVAVSHAIRNIVKTHHPGHARHLLVIPNGVGRDFLDIPFRDAGKDGGPIRFTAMGNLIPQKGFDIILHALKKTGHPKDSRLQIIGDGPEKASLTALAADLGISEQVRFAGSVPHERIPAHLADTDALILSSFGEGRPNVVLEAMAAGIPVIASDIDGARELVRDGETGLLFEAGNPDQLAIRMNRLAAHPDLRQELGKAGRDFIIRSGLTWDNAASRYAEIYRELTTHNPQLTTRN